MSTRRTFLTQGAAIAASSALGSLHAATDLAETKHHPNARKLDQKAKELRLAIVGTGQISARYFIEAKGNERAKFVATCARTIDSAKARAAQNGIPAWFDNYRKMYDEVKPDAVIVATPTPTHAEIAIAALERGIHVMCEKPMAMNLEDCHAMADAAKKSKVVLMTLPYEGGPYTSAALEYLNEQNLGVFIGAQSEMYVPGMARTDWYYDGSLAGPAFGEMFVYPISSLVSFLGPARRVTGFINTLLPTRVISNGTWADLVPPPRDPSKGRTVRSTAADNATLVIEWPDGQHGVARAIWGPSIVHKATTIYGRHGTLWLTSRDLSPPKLIVHSPERVIPGGTLVNDFYSNSYHIDVQAPKNEGLIDHFVDCIYGTTKPACGPEQALHIHEILYKGNEAVRSGKTQELATTFSPWHNIDPMFLDTRSRAV